MSFSQAQLWAVAANEEEGAQYDTASEYAEAGIPEEAAYLSDAQKDEWKKLHTPSKAAKEEAVA